MAFDLMDLAARYAQNRWDNATQLFTDPEEALRKRLAAQGIDIGGQEANVAPKTTTIRENEDGTSTVTTKRELPAAPVAPQADMPMAPTLPQVAYAQPVAQPTQIEATPLAPLQAQQMPAPQMPAPAPIPQSLQQPAQKPPQEPVQVSPEYLARIQQAESGNNPNIGSHGAGSSAYGPYGMTNAAWQDAQKRNPALAGVAKEQATPEQMAAAAQAYTEQNIKALQNYGIEPNDRTLSAAHFLGAKGLSDYLKTGYVSPAAAKANGGEENVRRIADQRLAGQAGPASGAVQPAAAAAPATPMDNYQPPSDTDKVMKAQTLAQEGNLKAAAALMADNVGTPVGRVAADIVKDNLLQKENEAKAAKQAEDLLRQPNGAVKMAREVSKPSEEGSYLKAYLFARLGLTDLAHEEQRKLGAGAVWKPTMTQDGEQVWIKYNANNAPVKGFSADRELSPEELLVVSGQGNVENIKTLQTQAHHSSASEMDAMRKINRELIDKKMPPRFTEEQILQRGREVYDQTMRVTRGGGRVAGMTSMTGTKAPGVQVAGPMVPGALPGATGTTSAVGSTGAGATPVSGPVTTTYTTHTGAPSVVFGNWNEQRVGESTKDFGKRLEIRPEDVEITAQALATGQMKPSELSGRQNDFRRVAVERALEINPKYSPQLYNQIDAVVKRYTSGKDHDTLVNTGTAVNHLLQFKDIAAQTPGNTDVSSWNAFYQNLMKYGNAPEIKSKEQMAGFVAGELVKAASGGQGSMTERIHQEQQLMKANTPAEVQMVIDNAIRLAHGRYSSMRSSFMGATGRKKEDFDAIVGMPEEASKAFAKVDAEHAMKSQGSAAEKWAREHPNDPRAAEILKRLGKQ